MVLWIFKWLIYDLEWIVLPIDKLELAIFAVFALVTVLYSFKFFLRYDMGIFNLFWFSMQPIF
jgi:hypothetical protein